MLPWNAEDLTIDETRFKGTARLFPLPDLVMFPHVMQPLHIYEPRYRDLLNSALDSDGLIAMSMLAPGWEEDYEGRPQLLKHACLSKIVTHQRQDDGHYNILLLGLRRITIDSELPADQTYREGKVTLLEDYCDSDNDKVREALQAELTEKFQESQGTSNPNVEELLATEIPLGVLTDLVSFATPLELEVKSRLLSESNVDLRAEMLLTALREADNDTDNGNGPPGSSYFPPFSVN